MNIEYEGKEYKFTGKEMFGRKIKRVVPFLEGYLAIVTKENWNYKVLFGVDEMTSVHSIDKLIDMGLLI